MNAPELTPRQYQRAAVNNVMSAWRGGARSVLLVAPTGSGKTFMARMCVERAFQAGARGVVVAHRIELINQLCDRLPESAPICPGLDENPDKPIQVGTIQTLLSRNIIPKADFLVFDEAHHYVSDEWRKFAGYYPDTTRILGLTATPERGDGRPLGDMFETMVVAANYSHLISQGYIVDCDVFSIDESMDSGKLALHPAMAHHRFAPNGKALCFVNSIFNADSIANSFNEIGYPAAAITAETNADKRAEHVTAFRDNKLRVLINVYTLTEGFDVPDADTAILARNVTHASTYLQMVGRVLRASPGKKKAKLIDLTGAWKTHGLPTMDRQYSLSGKAISYEKLTSLRVCLKCGYTHASAPKCPRCHFVYPITRVKPPVIYDMKLRRVYDGARTPMDAKEDEMARLIMVANDKGFDLGWAARQYKSLFNEEPAGYMFDPDSKMAQYKKWKRIAQQRGWNPKFADVRYKKMFGSWPNG